LNLHVIFQWHELLHFILPIVIIVALRKRRLGLANVCVAVFMFGSLKEIRDMIFFGDPLWVSAIDTCFNAIGIALGIVSVKFINNRRYQGWQGAVMVRCTPHNDSTKVAGLVTKQLGTLLYISVIIGRVFKNFDSELAKFCFFQEK